MLDKLEVVKSRGLQALLLARAEGVPLAFGTDLLGAMQPQQNQEFAIRAAVQPAVEVLQSATIVAARLMGREAEVGQLVPGALADLLLVDGDPTADLAPLVQPEQGIRLLLQGGRRVIDRLAA